MRLRKYQSDAIKRVAGCFVSGAKSVLCVAPTGAGKGTMAVAMIASAVSRGERALFLVHRREIVADVKERLVKVGCSMSRVEIATVQTLARRKRHVRVDLVIADEAHHYRAEEWQDVLRRVGKKALLVGFTATPQRADGKAMGDVFDALVDVASYSELLALGYIVPCKVMTTPYAMDKAIAMRSVDAYLRYAGGTSALAFERDVKTARASLKAFRGAGIASELFVQDTSLGERAAALQRFRTGAVKVLIGVYVLTEGVDLPWAQTILLARTCQHVGTYMQIAGRALRRWPGKKSALLIDLASASYVHGVPTSDREYTLSGVAIAERDAVAGRQLSVSGLPRDVEVANVDLVEFSEGLRQRERVKRGAPSAEWLDSTLRAAEKVGNGIRIAEAARSEGLNADAFRCYLKKRGLIETRAESWSPTRSQITSIARLLRAGQSTELIAATVGLPYSRTYEVRRRLMERARSGVRLSQQHGIESAIDSWMKTKQAHVFIRHQNNARAAARVSVQEANAS